MGWAGIMKSWIVHRLLDLGIPLLVLGLLLAPAVGSAQTPVAHDREEGPRALAAPTPSPSALPDPDPIALPDPDLIAFSEQLGNSAAGEVAGLYADGLFAFPVVQQPAGQPAFVSSSADTLTQFSMAASYGSLGFLGHVTLAGSRFSSLAYYDQLVVIFGDDQYASYRVTQIRRFQALQPTNPYSSFVDLATGETLSAEQLFFQTYGVAERLVLQTCIASEGEDSWGRLFVIAEPVSPEPPGSQSN
jgi:hypothetical protein